ncbi:ATP-binding protein [Burkholderia sp. MSMB1459WGS]|uniref:ATP-binding protein n=1 Tax=Burkholderia sp. MSMB1459WGS TaxID=1637970 RepID=UPI000A3E4BB2|nr:ATP-binding protein [Burkholderia sp. MSMB1459WGS]
MKPSIEFKHVLGELSVNRNDPCEVIRELISNSYDANAKNLFYAALQDTNGFIFFDDGEGLSTEKKINGITPWEAFFSIGKSTKKKGDAIGYKCQGSKLCFACARIFVASKISKKSNQWNYKIVENPRNNLDVDYDIDPTKTSDISEEIRGFIGTVSSATSKALEALEKFTASPETGTGTLIIIGGLDTENFGKYFTMNAKAPESYLYNYIRFYTRHGDIRKITTDQGFTANQIAQIAQPAAANFSVFSNKKLFSIPFGYPYLDTMDADVNVKTPSQVSRLRDGRFFSRSAKSFSVGGNKYSIVFSVDGNRRAHEEYANLARKGQSKSGIKLSDHRGVFVSVKGIKICKYLDLLLSLEDYSILSEGDSPSHYAIIIDGDFDLVTNRNALSKKAYDTLSDPEFIKKVKEFLDAQRTKDKIFSELVSRLRRESSENLLNEQIEILNESRNNLKRRERFRIEDLSGKRHLFLSPLPGEEYLVGVLYAMLGYFVPADSDYREYWRQIITFSTQGIDSLAYIDPDSNNPLKAENIQAVEYKYEFNNFGPFNHALAVVDYIVAWEVNVDLSNPIRDSFTCFGKIRETDIPFVWEIHDIENDEGGEYPTVVRVIELKELIRQTFGTDFKSP